jgi:hypothetical protein
MDVRVEADVCTAKAELHEVKVVVAPLSNVVIIAPTIIRFSLTPVISVGGNSISSITPNNELIGVKAAS